MSLPKSPWRRVCTVWRPSHIPRKKVLPSTQARTQSLCRVSLLQTSELIMHTSLLHGIWPAKLKYGGKIQPLEVLPPVCWSTLRHSGILASHWSIRLGSNWAGREQGKSYRNLVFNQDKSPLFNANLVYMCQEKYIFRAKSLASKIFLNYKQMNTHWTRTNVQPLCCHSCTLPLYHCFCWYSYQLLNINNNLQDTWKISLGKKFKPKVYACLYMYNKYIHAWFYSQIFCHVFFVWWLVMCKA